VLPQHVKKGLVELVEVMHACNPPFPVFKSLIIERAQCLVQSIPEFKDFWAATDNKPTDRWYYAWKSRHAERLGSGAQCLVEISRVEWVTSSNIKLYNDVVGHRLLEQGFMEANPAFDQTLPWTREREASSMSGMIRGLWTQRGRKKNLFFDETELTTTPWETRRVSRPPAIGGLSLKVICFPWLQSTTPGPGTSGSSTLSFGLPCRRGWTQGQGKCLQLQR
jgi:hypothetical protein